MTVEIIWDNLAFFSRVLLVIVIYQHITDNHISKRFYLLIPLILRILFLVVPALAYFLTLLFLVVYSLYKNYYDNRYLDIFYGLFPVIVESLFKRLIIIYILPVFRITCTVYNQSYFWEFLVELLIFPIYYYLMRSLKVNFKRLKSGFEKQFSKTFLFIADVSMIIYFVILQVLLIFGTMIKNDMDYRKYLVTVYIILFLIMLVYINGVFNEKLDEEIIAQKDKKITDLTNYSKQIEHLYREIRNFRHDYINILSCIKNGIDNRDIDAIDDVYKNVLAKSGKYIQGKHHNIANLINITEEAIKSILSAKILEAQNKGVEMNIEIAEPFDISEKMDLLDFITILTILLDNAIEAVYPDKNDTISVALIAGDTPVVIVENSIATERVDISKIFYFGYSTKGEHRGIGLSKISGILEKYPRCLLQTQSKNYQFSQTLVLRS